MMYLIWKMDNLAVIASVSAEQLTGLIRIVKGQRAGVIASMPNLGGLTAY